MARGPAKEQKGEFSDDWSSQSEEGLAPHPGGEVGRNLGEGVMRE